MVSVILDNLGRAGRRCLGDLGVGGLAHPDPSRARNAGLTCSGGGVAWRHRSARDDRCRSTSPHASPPAIMSSLISRLLSVAVILGSVCASEISAECSGGAAWVPVGNPFAGFMICGGDCGGSEDDCVQTTQQTGASTFQAFCGCSNDPEGPPSDCCSLIMEADVQAGTVTPSVAGACGGSCPASGECTLSAADSWVWNPQTEQWEFQGWLYSARCSGS